MLGAPRLLGVPEAGRGRGAENLRLSAPDPFCGAQFGAQLGCPCPRVRSGWQGANGRGRRSSATCAGHPLPKVPSSPARSLTALTCEPGALQKHRRDPRPSRGCPLHRDPVFTRPAAVGPAAPPLCASGSGGGGGRLSAQPRPPLRPRRQWKTPGLAALTHARPPARPPAAPPRRHRPLPRPEPGAAAAGVPADLNQLRRRHRSPPSAPSHLRPSVVFCQPRSRSFTKSPTHQAGAAGLLRSPSHPTYPVDRWVG